VIIAYVERMLRSLRWTLVLSVFGFGCGVGGGGGSTDAGSSDAGGSDAPTIPPQDTNDQSITCTAQITLTGKFTPAAPIDPNAGCQPTGVWAVTATVSDNGNCSNVKVKASYTYTLTGTGHDTKVSYSGKASGEEFQGNVSANGNGACSGAFEHILADGSSFDQIVLHPLLPRALDIDPSLPDVDITGTGEFDQWSRHP
jgi:hypothetical protein